MAKYILGVDVSKYQGEIDWGLVAGSPQGGNEIRFAIVRATIGDYYTDPELGDNVEGARAHGLPVSYYHVVKPGIEVEKQLAHFATTVAPYGAADFNPVLDVELPADNNLPARLDCALKAQSMAGMMLGQFGYTPIIYTGTWWMQPVIDQYGEVRLANLGLLDLHVAQYVTAEYPKIPTLWKSYKLWQYTSSGRVPGIAGNVDINRFNGSEQDFARFIPPKPVLYQVTMTAQSYAPITVTTA